MFSPKQQGKSAAKFDSYPNGATDKKPPAAPAKSAAPAKKKRSGGFAKKLSAQLMEA